MSSHLVPSTFLSTTLTQAASSWCGFTSSERLSSQTSWSLTCLSLLCSRLTSESGKMKLATYWWWLRRFRPRISSCLENSNLSAQVVTFIWQNPFKTRTLNNSNWRRVSSRCKVKSKMVSKMKTPTQPKWFGWCTPNSQKRSSKSTNTSTKTGN